MCPMTYTIQEVMAQRHNYNIRDVPNELRNFHAFLSKSPQLADKLQLTRASDEGVIQLSNAMVGEDIVDFGKIKAILNKLTAQNYSTMIVDLKRKTHRMLFDDERVIDILVQNIQFSDAFMELYAALVQDLDGEEGTDRFSRGIAKKCLEAFLSFQADSSRTDLLARLFSVSDSDVKMEIEGKIKRENIAVVMFLGHLYQRRMLPTETINIVLARLMDDRQGRPDEYNVDFMLSLIPTILSRLRQEDHDSVCAILDHLQALKDRGIPMRLKFKLQDFLAQYDNASVESSENNNPWYTSDGRRSQRALRR